MTKTLDQLAASTTTADADLLLKRDNASGDDKKIREDDLQLARSAVRQINVGGAADYTLTNGDAGRPLIELIGALTDNIDVIVPTSGRQYTFVNSTSGSFTINVKTSAGTGVLLPQGELRTVRCDGTNVITGDGFSDFTSMPEVSGDPIVESGSNSDGEWVKWSEGRALVIAEFNVDMTITGNQTPLGAFAIPLLNSSSDLITGGGSKAHDEGITIAERDSFKNSFLYVTSGAWVFSCDGTGANASKPMTAFALGRWK